MKLTMQSILQLKLLIAFINYINNITYAKVATDKVSIRLHNSHDS